MTLHIVLMGPPSLVVEGKRLTQRSRKTMALLAYLAMQNGAPVTRTHVAGLLWGDSAEAQARTNLRQAISLLRKLFRDAGHDPLQATSGEVLLDPETIEVDALQAKEGRLSHERHVAALKRPFLQGFETSAPEFEIWAQSERREIETKLCNQLQSLAQDRLKTGEVPSAIANLTLLVSVDPIREDAQRLLISALEKAGRTDAALAQYETCRRILDEHLGIEPDAETRAAVAHIRARRLTSVAKPDTPFEKYPAKKDTLVYDTEGEHPRMFDDPNAALRHALLCKRSGSQATSWLVTDQRVGNAEAVLACAEGRTILVAERVFNLFRNASPFSFEPAGEIGTKNWYTLIGEEPRHRLQLSPTVKTPEHTPTENLSAVVLPFRDYSTNAADLNMGDFFAEEMTNALAGFRNMALAAPTAAQTCKSFSLTNDQIRDTLGVNYLVDGSLKRDDDAVAISISVSDLRTGQLTYSERFEGRFGEFVGGHELLIKRIANAIFRRTESSEMSRSRKMLTENMSAFDLYLRGLSHLRRSGILLDHAKSAVEHFNKAIKLDQEFLRAYAQRVCAIGWYNPDYYWDKGFREIQWAMSVDDTDPEVLRIAGFLYLYSGDVDRCISLLERAVQMNPADAYLMASAAINWAYKGDPESGLHHIDMARRIDPFLPSWCLEDHGAVLYSMGEFEQAIEVLNGITVPTPRAFSFLAAAQVACDRLDEAGDTIRALTGIAPNYSVQEFLRSTFFKRREDNKGLEKRLTHAGLA